MKKIDPEAWRFESMARTGARMAISGDYSEELVRHQIVHLMCQAFRQGVDEGLSQVVASSDPIPVTDLTHIPELGDHIRERNAGNVN